MIAKPQLPKVNCKYGAPMGRDCYGIPTEKNIRLFKVYIDNGGYDQGGAYWGLGDPLYCATDNEGYYRDFVRARSRKEAARLLKVGSLLMRGVL